MKMNQTVRRLLIFISIIIVGAAIIIIPQLIDAHRIKQMSNAFMMPSAGQLAEQLKTTPSDIEGMSQYDKQELGLDPRNNSDSDFDGLTDKEEIEVYGTDPLKMSTTDDYYSDGYKVYHNMDLFTCYEYQNDRPFLGNSCEEITLQPTCVEDFIAVVGDETGVYKIDGVDIFKQYNVYHYSGVLNIDVTEMLRENDITLDEIDMYVLEFNDDKMKSLKFTADGNLLTTEQFDYYGNYDVFIVRKGTLTATKLLFQGIDVLEITDDTDTFTSNVHENVIVLENFVYNILFRQPTTIFCLGDADQYANEIIKIIDPDLLPIHYSTMYSIKSLSKQDYTLLRTFLIKFLPFCEVSNYKELNLLHFLTCCYYRYDINIASGTGTITADQIANDANNEASENVETNIDATKPYVPGKFNFEEEILPFKNFASYVAGGNCAGIAHLTTILHNTGSAPSSGAYLVDTNTDNNYKTQELVCWDLSTNPENATLCDFGLSDYKDANYKPYSGSRDTIPPDEKAFIDMIACYYTEGNELINDNDCGEACKNGNHDYTTKEHRLRLAYAEQNTTRPINYTYDYALIEEIINYLDNNKILDLYLGWNLRPAIDKENDGIYEIEGTGIAHVVNIIGYKKVSNSKLILYIYDNEHPTERKEIIIKKQSIPRDDGTKIQSFHFIYRPDFLTKGTSVTSLGKLGRKYTKKNRIEYFSFIAVDENWSILNLHYDDWNIQNRIN